MILAIIISVLLVGGILSWLLGKVDARLSRWIALISCLVDLIIVIALWIKNMPGFSVGTRDNWILIFRRPWIERFGIEFNLALDGLSLLLLFLTFFLGFISVMVSWKQIKDRVGFYHFNLLWVLAGISGVFLAVDLFLFYFFWEVMLIPMYFLIGIWGYENRIYASYKFFIFTQASGLLMFISILALYFLHGAQTGHYTFNYQELLDVRMNPYAAMLLMSGFLIAFLVKLPAVPFHTWLPDAHTEAPTAGSVILAGLLLKTGAYGMIRFVLPLFPDSVVTMAPYGMLLGVVSILYGAKLAFSQTDLKRLVAYSSVSHMGFILLGFFALNQLAYQGIVIQMLAHGISTGALFILVGALQERIHTRDIQDFSGLWKKLPVMGSIMMIFVMASLGLPGLGNFIAEFLILTGTYQENVMYTVLASAGLVAATLYSLKIFQKTFHGEEKVKKDKIFDLNVRELIISGLLIIAIFWLGLFPGSVLQTSRQSIKSTLMNFRTISKQQKDPDNKNYDKVKIKPVNADYE